MKPHPTHAPCFLTSGDSGVAVSLKSVVLYELFSFT